MKLLEPLLKYIWFSNKKNDLCYYYIIDESISEIETMKEYIPIYQNHPTKLYSKLAFYNLIINLPINEIEEFICTHITFLCENDIQKQKDLLLKMRISFFDSFKTPRFIRFQDWLFNTKEKYSNHINEFKRIVDFKLNKLEFDFGNLNLELLEFENKKIRLIHEVEKVLSEAGLLNLGEKKSFRFELAKILKYDISNEAIKDGLIDLKGNYNKTLKNSKIENWLFYKKIENFIWK